MLAPGPGDAHVVAPGEAQVAAVLHHGHAVGVGGGQLVQEGQHVRARAVVHEHQLVARVGVAQQGGGAELRVVQGVPGQHHHRDRAGAPRRFGQPHRGAGVHAQAAGCAGADGAVGVADDVGRRPVQPALAQQAHVLGHLRPSFRAALGLVVDDHALGPVDHQTARLAQAQAEVDVLVAVPIGGIEAAQGLEHLAAHGHDRGGDRLQALGPGAGRIVGGLRVADVQARQVAAAVLAAVLHQDHAPMLDGAVGVEQARAHGAHPRVQVQGVHQGIEPARGDLGVVVQEEQVPAPGRGGALVAGGGEPGVGLVGHRAQTPGGRGLAQPGGGAVGRGVVHHDHLERRGRRRPLQGVQAGPGQLQAAVHGDDDGHVGAARSVLRGHGNLPSRPESGHNSPFGGVSMGFSQAACRAGAPSILTRVRRGTILRPIL